MDVRFAAKLAERTVKKYNAFAASPRDINYASKLDHSETKTTGVGVDVADPVSANSRKKGDTVAI